MSLKLFFLNGCLPRMKQGLATLMVLQLLIGAPISAMAEDGRDKHNNPDRDTRTPIKHVIVINWRKPHLRPCLRHVSAGRRAKNLQPSYRRNH